MPKRSDRLHAERRELARLAREPVDRELVDPGIDDDRPPDVLAGNDEERLDEVVGLERRLADEVAQRRGSPQPTRALRARRRAEARRAGEWNYVTSFPRSATRAPE